MERDREEVNWQNAVIATSEHVLTLHTNDPGTVSCYAGQIIRVRLSDEAQARFGVRSKIQLGCDGRLCEVHPEDAERLWPNAETGHRVAICDCSILTD